MKPLTARRLEILVREEFERQAKQFSAQMNLEPDVVRLIQWLSRHKPPITDWLESKEFKRILDAKSQESSDERLAVMDIVNLVRRLDAIRRDQEQILDTHPTVLFSVLERRDAGEIEEIQHLLKLFKDLEAAVPQELHLSLSRFQARALRAVIAKYKKSGDPKPHESKRLASQPAASAWRSLRVRELRSLMPVSTVSGSATIAGLLRLIGDKDINHRHVESILKAKGNRSTMNLRQKNDVKSRVFLSR